jgi:hypothetical protein
MGPYKFIFKSNSKLLYYQLWILVCILILFLYILQQSFFVNYILSIFGPIIIKFGGALHSLYE